MFVGHLSSLVKCLFRSSTHFWIGSLFFFNTELHELCILEINPLSVASFADIFSRSDSCQLSFHFILELLLKQEEKYIVFSPYKANGFHLFLL